MSTVLDEYLDQDGTPPPPEGPIVGGRFVIYDAELPLSALRGTCAVTGKSPEPGVRFVDIGVEVLNDTPNGDVCLCEEYVVEMGVALGLIQPAAHQAALDALAGVQALLEEQTSELEYLRALSPSDIATADTLAEILSGIARLEELATAPQSKRRPAPKSTTDPQEG